VRARHDSKKGGEGREGERSGEKGRNPAVQSKKNNINNI
jgi:hypothetical protein